MKTVVVLKENELNNAMSVKEFLTKSSDNSHIMIDKAIILKALVDDIIPNEELKREKIIEMAEEIIKLCYEVRGNADLVLEALPDK